MGKVPARESAPRPIPKMVLLQPHNGEFIPLRDIIPQAIRDHFDSTAAKSGR